MSGQETDEFFDADFDFDETFEEDQKKAAQADAMSGEEKENRKRYSQQIELLEAFQKQMQTAFGKKIELSFSTPFSPANNPKANDDKAIVFLTKNITGVSVHKTFEHVSGGRVEEKIESVVTEYDGYLKVTHTHIVNGNEAKHFLSIGNMQIQDDIYAKEEGTVKNALFETARAVLFLAREARLAGEKNVDFGRTTDPIYRLALEIACKIEKLDYSTETLVDLQNLPKTFYADRLADELSGTILKVKSDIFSAPSLTDKPEIKHQLKAA